MATAFDFRAWGALQKADYANGRRLALGYNQLRSQLTNLKLQKTDNSDVVTNISYDYYNGGGGSGGNNGRIRYITDHLDGNYSVDVGYDDYNRLTSYGSYRSYTYDAWNNLLSVSSSNGVGEAPNYTLTYATNASGAPATNRINNSGYTYDNAGNVTNDGSLAYAYDAAGRLKTAGTNNSCEYDGDGRKVKQVSGGYPLFYLWSSVLGEPVVELDGSGGVYRAYVLSSGGQTIAVQSYDGGFYWLHTDHLGNGRKLTNSSGTVIYRAEFDPHGQMLYEWQSSGQTYLNSHKFTGYERDWATNLNYAKARTYQHNRARFLQPDPLGLAAANLTDPQSLNRYSYVGNDPVNFVDPSGLFIANPTPTPDELCALGFGQYCPRMASNLFAFFYNSLNRSFGGSWGVTYGGGGGDGQGNQTQSPNSCPPVPEAPPGVDLKANIQRAKDQKPKSPFKAYDQAEWFKKQVDYGGPWDYKTRGSKYEAFGNFHYGATGAAIGFSDNTLLRMAGWAQQQHPENGKGDGGDSGSKPAIIMDMLLGVSGGTPPYGDFKNDQEMIKKGIEYFRNGCYRSK